MSIVFHIGYPKSASTWLQENLFPKITNFTFINQVNTNEIFLSSDVFQFNPKEIRNRFLLHENIIFSSESITTPINKGWHYGVFSKTQADKIKATFPQAKIIIIIRNQQSLIASAYQQFIKNGGVESFNCYLNSGKYFSFQHLNFYLLIRYYESLFYKENVFVYMYEDFLHNPTDFVKSLMNQFNFEIDIKQINFSRVNRGLRINFIPCLKFFNLFHRRPKLKIHYLMHLKGMSTIIKKFILPLNNCRLFGRYAKPEDFLKRKDWQYIKDYYGQGNRKLSERINQKDLQNNGYFL